jgi:hypothetical protein
MSSNDVHSAEAAWLAGELGGESVVTVLGLEQVQGELPA